MKIKRCSPGTFTLIPRDLEVRPGCLDRWNAYALMNRLHSQIKRARVGLTSKGLIGPMTSDDWLIAGLHNELDPTVPLYQFHYHGTAAGQMIVVLDGLRDQRAYEYREGDRVRDRARMSRRELDNFPAPFGYSHQLFVPARARGDGSDDDIGFNQLHRTKRRLPEPYHTQILLWLDRQRIEDMTLLMGLRVGPNGFVKTYVKGGGQ